MTTDEVFDLLDHAVEPEPWLCDDPWEYRAMHWRPSEAAPQPDQARPGQTRSLAGSVPG